MRLPEATAPALLLALAAVAAERRASIITTGTLPAEMPDLAGIEAGPVVLDQLWERNR